MAGFGISHALRGVGLRGWNEPLLGLVISSSVARVLQCATTRDWAKVARDLRGCNTTGWGLYVAAGIATVGGPVLVSMAMLHIAKKGSEPFYGGSRRWKKGSDPFFQVTPREEKGSDPFFDFLEEFA